MKQTGIADKALKHVMTDITGIVQIGFCCLIKFAFKGMHNTFGGDKISSLSWGFCDKVAFY